MKDFPFFPTEYGVAGLVLKQIPYRGEAYITVQDTQPDQLELLLNECAGFCRMAGAERIYATGHDGLERYPLYTAVVEMRGEVRVDPDHTECYNNFSSFFYSFFDTECLFPVTEATVGQWRQIYNDKMRPVDCAAILAASDEKKILSSGGAYFVHRDGELLGIGWLEENSLLAVCAVKGGAGMAVMQTLMSLVEEEQLVLEVASTNERAIRLYEKLGFLKVKETKRWYKIG